MRKAGLRIAILDPGTLLARDVKALLEERAFPAGRTDFFHTRPLDAGLLADEDGEAAYVSPLEPGSLEGCALAFACGAPADLQRVLAARDAGDGATLVDLTGRLDGRERGEETDATCVVADPVAVAVSDAIASLSRLGPVASAFVAVDRPASESGKPALDELMAQAIALASFRPVPTEVLPAQLAFNFVQATDAEDYEARLTAEIARGVPRGLALDVVSARTGTFHGHHVRLGVRFAADAPSADDVRKALVSGVGFAAPDADEVPVLTSAAGRDEPYLLRAGARGSTALVAFGIDHLRMRALAGVKRAEVAVTTRGLLAGA